MKRPIYAAIASSKGGVGKTTLTMLSASNLHYGAKLNVVVVDCNYPRYPIARLRERETAQLEQNARFKEQVLHYFHRTGQTAYLIANARVDNAIQVAQQICTQEPAVDMVLFDIPQLMAVEGTSELLTQMEVLFFPVADSAMELSETERYLEVFNEQVITMNKGSVREVYLLANRVDPRRLERAQHLCRTLADLTGVALIKTMIPQTRQAQADLFESPNCIGLSTLAVSDRRCRRLRAKELASELSTIINRLCGRS